MEKKFIFTKDVGKSHSSLCKHFIQRKRFCDGGEGWRDWAWQSEEEKGKVRAIASSSDFLTREFR